MAAPSPQQLRLRVFHQLESARNGRELQLCLPVDDHHVRADVLLAALRHAVPPRYDPHVFHAARQCFVSLHQLAEAPIALDAPPDHAAQPPLPPRVDVKLVQRVQRAAPQPSSLADRLLCDSAATPLSGAWFGVGIIRGKSASNHGSLWRSALQFGAAITFTIGKRYQKNVEGCADVYKTHRQLPCIAYQHVAAFMDNAPIDAQVVVVEYGGTDLVHFQHPKRALYVLGAEDTGVPPAFVRRAHCHVSIPTAHSRPTSLNVAAAAAIVLYDRHVKLSEKARQKQP